MKQVEQLQVFELQLTTRAPLHIGNGASYQKFEYLYSPQTRRVSIIRQDAFFAMLVKRNLVDAYEAFVLNANTQTDPYRSNLYRFLREGCKLADREIGALVRYTVDATDALLPGKPFQEIKAFQRDAQGRAYVPGSSVKGALRTAFLLTCIQADDKPRYGTEVDEKRYMNVLRYKPQHPNDEVNSLFRGVRVSDSAPIAEDAMTLAGKHDVNVRGEINQINVCRECVRPGETVRIALTLDQSILRGRITRERILESIQALWTYAQETYHSHFTLPVNAVTVETDRPHLLLGGGAGFFSKTLIYPYFGEERALALTAAKMQKKFSEGHHERDEALGISPHMLQYTRYAGKLYPFGLCEVALL